MFVRHFSSVLDNIKGTYCSILSHKISYLNQILHSIVIINVSKLDFSLFAHTYFNPTVYMTGHHESFMPFAMNFCLSSGVLL